MKRVLLFILTLGMVLSLCGCRKESEIDSIRRDLKERADEFDEITRKIEEDELRLAYLKAQLEAAKQQNGG